MLLLYINFLCLDPNLLSYTEDDGRLTIIDTRVVNSASAQKAPIVFDSPHNVRLLSFQP